jgi:hypothetical protein
VRGQAGEERSVNLTEHKREAEIQDAIRRELGNPKIYPDVVLFRNNVGVLQDANGKHIRFGLCPGSADLIGIFTKDLSNPIGMFIAAEIKTPDGRQSPEQINFERLVTRKGAVYAVLRSVEDAVKWIEKLRSE